MARKGKSGGTTVKFELHKLYVGHGTKDSLPHMSSHSGKGGKGKKGMGSGHMDPWNTKHS